MNVENFKNKHQSALRNSKATRLIYNVKKLQDYTRISLHLQPHTIETIGIPLLAEGWKAFEMGRRA